MNLRELLFRLADDVLGDSMELAGILFTTALETDSRLEISKREAHAIVHRTLRNADLLAKQRKQIHERTLLALSCFRIKHSLDRWKRSLGSSNESVRDGMTGGTAASHAIKRQSADKKELF